MRTPPPSHKELEALNTMGIKPRGCCEIVQKKPQKGWSESTSTFQRCILTFGSELHAFARLQ